MRTVLLTVAVPGLVPPENAVVLVDRGADVLIVRGRGPAYPALLVMPPADSVAEILDDLLKPWLDCVRGYANLRFGRTRLEAEFVAEVSSCGRSLTRTVVVTTPAALLDAATKFLFASETLFDGKVTLDIRRSAGDTGGEGAR